MPYVVKNGVRFYKPSDRAKKKMTKMRAKLYSLRTAGRLISGDYLKKSIDNVIA